MIVFRVEDSEGGGPYNGAKAPYWADRERAGINISSTTSNHPLPGDDISGWSDLSIDTRSKYLFGFASLAELESWFNEKARAYYRDLGFKVAKYEVGPRSLKRGGHQVAFNKDRAKLIERTELIIFEKDRQLELTF